MKEGDKVRLRIQLYGSVPVGSTCTVTKVHDEHGRIFDVACDQGTWRNVHTVWAHEVEEISEPAAPHDAEPSI